MKFTLTANMYIQLGAETKPAPIPISITIDYNESSISTHVWSAAQTNLPLPQGTVDSPRVMVVEVLEGSVSLANNSAGDGAMVIAANPTPQAGDPASLFMFFSYDPAVAQWYVTTTGAAKVRTSFFA